jgi:hypothetical protein
MRMCVCRHTQNIITAGINVPICSYNVSARPSLYIDVLRQNGFAITTKSVAQRSDLTHILKICVCVANFFAYLIHMSKCVTLCAHNLYVCVCWA